MWFRYGCEIVTVLLVDTDYSIRHGKYYLFKVGESEKLVVQKFIEA